MKSVGIKSEKLLKLQLQTSAGLVSLISAYAPTLTSASELKDRFYDDLYAAISKVPLQEPLLMLGVFNARVDVDHSSGPTVSVTSTPGSVLITALGQLVWATLE